MYIYIYIGYFIFIMIYLIYIIDYFIMILFDIIKNRYILSILSM